MRMKKKSIRTALILLVTGLIVCGVSFAAMGFDAEALNTANYVTNTYEIAETFDNISIVGDVEDLAIEPAEDGVCRVICYEDERNPHDVRVEADTLRIDKQPIKWWRIGITIGGPKITVALPEGAYKTLSIEADTGDVVLSENLTFESASIDLDTGSIGLMGSQFQAQAALSTDTGSIRIHGTSAKDFTLSSQTGYIAMMHVNCGELNAQTDTGEVLLDHVNASGAFRIETDTGNVHFDSSDAEEIYVKTDTGDVTGTLLADKIFLTDSDTGSIDVPKTVTGGRCEITTDTGE